MRTVCMVAVRLIKHQMVLRRALSDARTGLGRFVKERYPSVENVQYKHKTKLPGARQMC